MNWTCTIGGTGLLAERHSRESSLATTILGPTMSLIPFKGQPRLLLPLSSREML
jgi:hypothetical protein